MEITAKELRGKPGQIIEQAARGTDVIITMRGKRLARLIPYKSKTGVDTQENDDLIFGLWKEREGEISVDAYVRAMRKRRSL
jgi:prevent-host-death family protein